MMCYLAGAIPFLTHREGDLTLVVTNTSCLGNFFNARPSSCTAALIS